MIRIVLLLWLCAVFAACSDLSDVDQNVCGNGILEAGEDCDSSDARCVACGIRCDMGIGAAGDAQCAEYPDAAGFVCGADELCHAPSGKFREATELSTSISTLRSTDVDNDGYGDVVVQSATSIRVLFGNPDGHPSTSQSVLTPIARGPAFYADLDHDAAGKLDVLLPASDGIVAYTSPYDVLSPFPFPSIVSTQDEGTPYFSNPVAPGVIGIVGRPAGTSPGSPVFYLVRDVSNGGQTFVAMAQVCGATDMNFDPRGVSIFDVRLNYQLFATTFRQGAAQKVCVLAIERVGMAYTVTELPVNLGAGRAIGSRAVLAPIGAGACPALVVREQNSGDVIGLAGTGTTTCSYSGAPSVRVLSQSFGDPVGWAPLQPADPSGATVALAMQTGVFAVPAAGPLVKLLYLADRPLASIQAGDFDGDNDVDIVASSATQAGELVEDIDVLSRFAMGFTRFRLDTDGPVDLLTIGDYDGNGVRDVAYVQTRVLGGANRYELIIAYATGDQLVPGVAAGTFGKVLSLIPADIPDSNDPFSVVTDLVALYQDGDQSAISLLHGSPQRTMLGFFDPRVAQQPTIFRGVAAGNFNDAAGPPGLDMVAIEDGDAGVPRIWRSNGPTGNEVTAGTASTVALLGDCNKGSPATSLCISDATFVAWPASDTRDVVIALGADRNGDPRVVTFDPNVGTAVLPSTMWPSIGDNKTRIRGAEVVRLASGPLLLVSTLVGLVPHTLACTLDATGNPAQPCTDLATVVGGDAVCTHATTMRIAPVTRFQKEPRTDDDLLAICRAAGAPTGTVYRIADGQATEVLRGVAGRELRAGDLDGNGVDDLLAIDRETAVPTLRIYRQCTAREATTCGR